MSMIPARIAVGLPATLLKLPRLKEFPRMRGVDEATLRQLVKRQGLQRLEISGLAEGTDKSILKLLGESNSLRILEIANVDLEDDDLQMLGRCENLQELALEDTNITGEGLRHLRGLQQLRQLRLSMDAGRVVPDLTELKSIDSLRAVILDATRFMPKHMLPLGDCRQLTHVVIGYGEADDSVAKRLAKLPNLRNLVLDSGHLTEQAVEPLAQCRSLESLAIVGSFSKQAILKLADSLVWNQLAIVSDKLSEDDIAELGDSLGWIRYRSIRAPRRRGN